MVDRRIFSLVADIRCPSIYQTHIFSQTIWPIELKFHLKTSQEKDNKMYANGLGHITKMANMRIHIHIYGKKLKNLLLQKQTVNNIGT